MYAVIAVLLIALPFLMVGGIVAALTYVLGKPSTRRRDT
jgi:hypothetical protein